MKKEIGNRVRQARKNIHITQEDLAEKADMSASFISRLENGNVMPSIKGLYTISQVLEVGLQDLLCDFFTAPEKTASVSAEIAHQIEFLSEPEKQHILEYIKSFCDFVAK